MYLVERPLDVATATQPVSGSFGGLMAAARVIATARVHIVESDFVGRETKP